MQTVEPPEIAESELIARAQEGDPDAFSRLMGGVQQRLLSQAIVFCHDPDLARDLMQEIAQVADPAACSVLSYRNAFAEGEDVLLAMLDQDARVVLPRSAAVFESNR